jgi:uncharacterized coiled-coil protein SlyX
VSTYDDRLTALEQKVADIELERLYEKRKSAESTPSEQAYDAKQTNHRLTMLLGIASGQEHDIKSMKDDIGAIKGQLIEVQLNINDLHNKFDRLEKLLLERLPPSS